MEVVMDEPTRKEKLNWHELIDSLKVSDLPDLDKVAAAFDFVINEHVEHSQRDIELARAMKDQEAVIREQIKQETIKYARKVFSDCYTIFVGRRAWDE
jgi:hypothetical protein